jgi:GTP-binding protein
MSILRQASFLTTVADLRQLPLDALAEVAFVGRSNAGKSSAINTLCDHTRLAYVSKTPGRTQHLNFFTVRPGQYLVDLPGYGFAKVPDEVQKSWNGLISPYLAKRPQLRGMVIIMDIRHPLTELDRTMIDWFLPTGTPVHILLSKADKITRQEQTRTLKAVTAEVAREGGQVSVQLFSSLKKTGVEEARAVILGWLSAAVAEQAEQAGEAVPAETVSLALK